MKLLTKDGLFGWGQDSAAQLILTDRKGSAGGRNRMNEGGWARKSFYRLRFWVGRKMEAARLGLNCRRLPAPQKGACRLYSL